LINTSLPNQRYFGIAPVHVRVNRAAELSLNTNQKIIQYDSPRFISVIEQRYKRQDDQIEESSVFAVEENEIPVNVSSFCIYLFLTHYVEKFYIYY
jgi:hypothetical protein